MPEWIVSEDDPDLHDVLLAMFELWGINGVVYKSAGQTAAVNCACAELPEAVVRSVRPPGGNGQGK